MAPGFASPVHLQVGKPQMMCCAIDTIDDRVYAEPLSSSKSPRSTKPAQNPIARRHLHAGRSRSRPFRGRLDDHRPMHGLDDVAADRKVTQRWLTSGF